METLVDLLTRTCSRTPRAPALMIDGGLRTDTWSYERLHERASSAAALLVAAGLTRGDRVLLCGPNTPRLAAAMFAVWMVGGVVIPLDVRTPEPVLLRLSRVARPRTLLYEGAIPSMSGVEARSLAELFDTAEQGAAWVPVVLKGQELAELVFTSGTTDDPKGVMLTHANIVTNVLDLARVLDGQAADQSLSLLPLSHMLEQTCNLFFPLYLGASVVYPSSRRSSVIRRTLARHRVTTMTVVPAVLEQLLGSIERDVDHRGRRARQAWDVGHRLAARLPMPVRRAIFAPVHRRFGGHLRMIVSGGAHLSPPLAAAWERMGFPIVQGYGATECAPVITCNHRRRRVTSSVGRRLPSVQVRINTRGEVLVRGPNVTPGYWENAAATAEAFTDGWYRTGDLGRLSSAGDLFLTGRSKDMIVLADGRNVFPEDVERELRAELAVRECVVVGKPDVGGVRVHGVIIPRDRSLVQVDAASELNVAIRGANGRLAPHQQISGFSVWPEDEFPRTPTLKVKRREVAGWAQGGESQSAESMAAARTAIHTQDAGTPEAGTLGRITPFLRRVAGRPQAKVGADTDLQLDLGLDSLARVELAVVLQDEMGVDLPDEELAAARTAGELAALLERPSADAPAVEPPRWALGRVAVTTRAVLHATALFPLLGGFLSTRDVRGLQALRGLVGPALLIANHSSHLDAPLVLAALPPRLRQRTAVAAAADYFYATRRRGVLASLVLNSFPFNRQGDVSASLQYCGELVDRGWSILIFPEGSRSREGGLQPFKAGIGLLARDLGVPVVPLYIDGGHGVLPKGARRPRRGPVTLSVGPPARFSPKGDPVSIAAELESMVRQLGNR